MGLNRFEKLICIQKDMNADKYCEILQDGVVKSCEKLEIKEAERIFQQDSDPKHTSKKIIEWF